MNFQQDINENEILCLGADVLQELLIDRTTGKNIFWATSDYEHLGAGYGCNDPILPESITGENYRVVMPRVLKSKEQQTARSKDMAEVFTPSWVCNAQNNLVDEAWFGRKDVFNTETCIDNSHSWQATSDPIVFPESKTWEDYVGDTRLEITCGEAPYLVSRYDTTTGQPIPLQERIGILDRKLRIVNEHTSTADEWLTYAKLAYQSTYGYEWQGDNLLLAREALLWTFIEYYESKFFTMPSHEAIMQIVYIISWNLWQMDGLKCVVPNSCQSTKIVAYDLFGESTEEITPCTGCTKDDIHRHNGQYCIIRDWTLPEDQQQLTFVSMIKH